VAAVLDEIYYSLGRLWPVSLTFPVLSKNWLFLENHSWSDMGVPYAEYRTLVSQFVFGDVVFGTEHVLVDYCSAISYTTVPVTMPITCFLRQI